MGLSDVTAISHLRISTMRSTISLSGDDNHPILACLANDFGPESYMAGRVSFNIHAYFSSSCQHKIRFDFWLVESKYLYGTLKCINQ